MTETPALRKCGDGYYRTSWVNEHGKRRQKSFGTKRAEALNRFSRWLDEWKRDASTRNSKGRLTIRAAWGLFLEHAGAYYRREDGTPTGEVQNLTYRFAPVLDVFGGERADRFSPLKLKDVRERMVGEDLSLGVINQRVNQIRRVFKWLASNELIPTSVWHSLQSIESLKAGRTQARATAPVTPVYEQWVWKTYDHLPPTLKAMIEFQYWTGCRPNEVCNITAAQIDMTKEIWVYRPVRHKTKHLGKKREILIGPRGQAVLRSFLQRDLNAPLFSPGEAVEQWNDTKVASYEPGRYDYRTMPSYQKRRAERTTHVRFGDRYTTKTYAKSIERVCRDHDIPHWSPNQLRHTAATRIREVHGLEAAQVILGHARADVTQIYAEASRGRAAKVVKEIG